jgi:hypothetical protein
MQELDDYKLEGYDCTLGGYPSPLIPIISRNSEYQAVYFDDNFQIQLRRIDAIDSDTTAKFSYLSNCHEDIKNKLEKFDYRKHKLFAKDENNVEFYEVEDETYFFVKLLIDKSFSKDNPFVRVSYAKSTGIKHLIDREKENYEQYLKTKSKDREKKFWEKYKSFTVEDTTSSLFNAIPVTGEKASEVGADYTELRDLLQNKNFEEAKKETERQFQKKLPELDKLNIEKLWVYYYLLNERVFYLLYSSYKSAFYIKDVKGNNIVNFCRSNNEKKFRDVAVGAMLVGCFLIITIAVENGVNFVSNFRISENNLVFIGILLAEKISLNLFLSLAIKISFGGSFLAIILAWKK